MMENLLAFMRYGPLMTTCAWIAGSEEFEEWDEMDDLAMFVGRIEVLESRKRAIG